MGALWDRVVDWARTPTSRTPRIGLALGGGFARGLAHIGVLKVLEENHIPIHAVSGTSAGAVVAGAVAGGATFSCLVRNARGMRFSDLAGWKISRLGFASNEPMAQFLTRTLPKTSFERLQIPLAVAATDLLSGEPVIFRHGNLIQAVRASCAYPGLFLPVQVDGRPLVDGAFSAPVPVQPLRLMGMTHIIAVDMGTLNSHKVPENLFQVVNQCFVLMQKHVGGDWRRQADVVIEPEVQQFEWDDFSQIDRIIAAGESAARAALPALLALISPPPVKVFQGAALPAVPGKIPLPVRSVV